MRRAILVAALLVAAAACSGDDGAAEDPPGRIAVIAADGNVVVVAPDGSGAMALTDDAGPRTQYSQPAWSHDGEWLAWVEAGPDQPPGVFALASASSRAVPVEAAPSQAGAQAWLHVARPDGSKARRVPTPFTPFYLYWSPAGDRVAFLGNDGNALSLGLLDDATGDGEARRLDSGSPYYFSWAPDGSRLLVHVGADRLGYLDLEGGFEPLPQRPGAFTAPEWSAEGTTLAFSVAEEGRQRLIATDAAGTETGEYALLAGFTNFVLGADETMAYVEFGGDGTLGPVTIAAPGEAVREVVDRPTLAFFWDPAGTELALLVLDQTEEGAWLRWATWDGTTLTQLGRFRPSTVFLTAYLQFYAQYAQSHSFWAPDGSALVHAGAAADGRQGVWVQPRDGGPEWLVHDGSFGVWSPA